MAEAAAAENQEHEESGQEKGKEKPETRLTRADYDRIQAEKASQNGWKDFDEYVSEGGDPEKWKTADAFNTYGELIGRVKRKEQEFEQRFEGLQRLSQAQLDAQREELMAKRDEIAEVGGKDAPAQLRAIDKQVASLTVVPVQQQIHPALVEWNAQNAWVDEDTPKAAYAKQVYAQNQNQGKTVEQSIAAVNAAIKQHYPTEKPKAYIPENEKGGGPKGFSNKSSAKTATMDNLTAEERKIWNTSSQMWKGDEKSFLADATKLRAGK